MDLFFSGAHRIGGVFGGQECFSAVEIGDHALTWVLYLSVTIGLFVALKVPARWAALCRKIVFSQIDQHHTLLDKVLGAAGVFVIAAQVYYKISSATLIFLLQPCHVLVAVMTIVLLCPPQSFGGAGGASTVVVLAWLMGIWGALLMPETGDLEGPFEAEVYWLEHIWLAAMPFYLLVRGGGAVAAVTTWGDGLLGVWSMFVYHFAFAQPVGLATKANLNFMLCPTPGLTALIGLVVAPVAAWPSYHTPVCLGGPVIAMLLVGLYLALAAPMARTARRAAKAQ